MVVKLINYCFFSAIPFLLGFGGFVIALLPEISSHFRAALFNPFAMPLTAAEFYHRNKNPCRAREL
jgi:hypothetical protein